MLLLLSLIIKIQRDKTAPVYAHQRRNSRSYFTSARQKIQKPNADEWQAKQVANSRCRRC